MKNIRKSQIVVILITAIGIAAIPVSTMSHGVDLRSYSDDDRPDKAGVLVIALVPMDVATVTKQELMDQRIKKAFPGLEVRWSYFDIGSEQADVFMTQDERLSPKKMLDQMAENGITHVAILPLSILGFLWQSISYFSIAE